MPNLHINGLKREDAEKVYLQIRELFIKLPYYGTEMVVAIETNIVRNLQGKRQPYILISSTLEDGRTKAKRTARILEIKEILLASDIGLDIEGGALLFFVDASEESKPQ